MKKLINSVVVFVMLVMTVASQSPFITQTAQFVVGPTLAIDIKFWGDDFITSRYSYEAGSPTPYNPELILLNQFGEMLWSRNFTPRELGSSKNLVISDSGLFCIFTLGDTIYKINKEGTILQKKFLNSTIVRTSLQSNGEIIVMEESVSATYSRFFVYNTSLDLIKEVIAQPGATYSVVRWEDDYFVSGSKYGGGAATNRSSHIAKYNTTGNLLWLKNFPDLTEMHLVINLEKLYFCGVDISNPYMKMIYGEIDKNSGNLIWSKQWGAPYPSTLATIIACKRFMASPDGGFIAIGTTTYPGQQISDYEPNFPAGLILGYSPSWDCSWVKTTSDAGNLLSGDLRDSSLVVFGNLGQFPTVAKVIIYSISGLTAVEDDEPGPINLSLGQNYPNPFNPSTNIKFSLTEVELVSLKVYDLLGSEVATLVNEELLAGEHEVSFEASTLASGMYIYTLSVGRHTESKKMVLIR